MPGYPALTYEKFAALTGEEQRAVLQHELCHMLHYYHATPAELTAILGDMCLDEACAPKTRERDKPDSRPGLMQLVGELDITMHRACLGLEP